MVRSSWFFLGFYEASRNLDLQSDARNNHVEACRPRAMCIPIVGAARCPATAPKPLRTKKAGPLLRAGLRWGPPEEGRT